MGTQRVNQKLDAVSRKINFLKSFALQQKQVAALN
jgi:hypothetical protein